MCLKAFLRELSYSVFKEQFASNAVPFNGTSVFCLAENLN
jgi:hypothetical protein